MKRTVSIPAKINLSLDVVGKRADGYHLLETVMQSIDLHDVISVSLLDPMNHDAEKIRITAEHPTFPCDTRNTCHKAARHFLAACSVKEAAVLLEEKQIAIHIAKHIPQAAGLAGGSADAAAVLYALNSLCGSPFSSEELSVIGAAVGADVPFCLMGGTVLCSGIGEVLDPLPFLDSIPVVLIKPDFGVSTPWVYEHLDFNRLGKKPDTLQVIEAIRKQDMPALFRQTANVLESVTLQAYPVLSKIKKTLLDAGATGSMMSGSGPSVFGIFPTGEQAAAAVDKIRKIPEFMAFTIIGTRTIRQGPLFVDHAVLRDEAAGNQS